VWTLDLDSEGRSIRDDRRGAGAGKARRPKVQVELGWDVEKFKTSGVSSITTAVSNKIVTAINRFGTPIGAKDRKIAAGPWALAARR
jgi:hypothetical protein